MNGVGLEVLDKQVEMGGGEWLVGGLWSDE